MLDQIKAVLLMVYSALSGFFLPIHDFIVAILLLLAVNFLSGWIEDSLHADGWKWKKAFRTMLECCVLCGIGAFIFVIGHFMHQQNGAVLDRHLCSRDLVLLCQHTEQLEEDSHQGHHHLPLHQFPALAGQHEVRGKDSVFIRIHKP